MLTSCQVLVTTSSLITEVDKSKLHKSTFGFIFDILLKEKTKNKYYGFRI
jgi:hypothetical protein